MKINHISDLLSTISQYNNVRITQTFTSETKDLIIVRCIPNTTILELTFLETSTVVCYKTVEEAAGVIDFHLNNSKVI
ncbi:hypothetical protein [Planococcus halotolerans]|uniref:Uncharacterized protein n=1 Tax=Planococcus halotolerans TaxID=2233542 RepID=A0A365KWQ4_9BACL|nr:hypothetical protein [Planococcus halotolerans]QHJ69207.1 hypothetical protein DNR44_000470 [Planococcus halotolerans]RAZ77590.1 hypothetical protein DP120_08885 [Planococcus halotolerans]